MFCLLFGYRLVTKPRLIALVDLIQSFAWSCIDGELLAARIGSLISSKVGYIRRSQFPVGYTISGMLCF